MSTLQERIAMAMERAGLKTADAARKCGISYQAMRKLVLGDSRSMDAMTLIRLAEACDVDPRWLLTGEGRMQRYYAVTEPQATVLKAMEDMTIAEQYRVAAIVNLVAETEKAKGSQ